MKRISILILSISLALMIGCEDKGTEPTNSAPKIQSVSATPSTVRVNEITTLICNATDADGDNLTYTWSANGGAFPNGETHSTVIWKAPMTSGSYELEVNVEDGKNTVSDKITIELANIPPNIPSNPLPSNNASNMTTQTTLIWECVDPDGDNLEYDIYFGTSSSPAKVASNQTANSYTPSSLQKNTKYYWKIKSNDNNGGETTSSVWEFTTGESSATPCPGIPTLDYEGKTYHTVQIGNQCWLQENMNVGTRINSIDGNGNTQNQTDNNIIEKYCYDDNNANCDKYGGLYQWDEAMQYLTQQGIKGICPSGWHIPRNSEMHELVDEVGESSNALKAIGEGNPNNGAAGTNTSGFSALLAGYRISYGGQFLEIRDYTYYWSSTIGTNSTANNRYVNYILMGDNGDNVGYFLNISQEYGYSVRCLKN